ncbi:MAG TPA: SURF1 family protein [Thiothrix sp.]|nr:SURF1 family protein [Thiothrix sp.]
MLYFNNKYFSPTLIPSIATFIVFVVLISLGFWQLDRAEEKRIIEHDIHQAQKQQALNLNVYLKEEVPASLLAKTYHNVEVEGRYDSQRQFLYDNRTHNGKPGYHVLTPLHLSDSEMAVLVNRGWIPYNGSRDNIPNIQVSNKKLVVFGQLRNPSRSIVLSNTHISQLAMKFPVTIQSISVVTLSQQLGYSLLPIVIELDKEQPLGFVREWQPYYGKIDKHIAYAIQWFLMAVILLFLYVKLNITKSCEKRIIE